jgi:Leucine-rich repeat (LRR) protein
LPDELWLIVFHYLSATTLVRSVALVNRRFSHLCRNAVVVDHLDLRWAATKLLTFWRLTGAPAVDRRLGVFVRRLRGARCVSLPNSWHTTGWRVVEHAANIVGDCGRQSLPCPIVYPKCSTLLGVSLLQGVETLDLSGCQWMDGSALGPIGKAKTLKSLSLRDWRRLNDDHLESLTQLNNLETLDLDGCDQIGNAGMVHLLHLKDCIKCLNVSRLSMIDDTGLETIANLLKLETLHINDLYDVSDKGIERLTSCLTKLKVLEMQGCHETSGESIVRIGQQLLELEELDCSEIFTLDRAWEGFISLALLRHLIRVDLGGCHVDDRCVYHLSRNSTIEELLLAQADITADGLAHIIEGMKELRVLSLEECAEISTDGYMALANAAKLEGLSLRGSGDVADEMMVSVCDLPKLKYLDLRECYLLTAACLEDIAQVTTLEQLCITSGSFGWESSDEMDRWVLAANFCKDFSMKEEIVF